MQANPLIKSKLHILWTGLVCLVVISACNPTRHLEQDQYLLTQNAIKLNHDKDHISKSNISGLIIQKPNVKFIGLFRMKMWLYYWANHGKDSKFNRWVKEKLGEPPAIYQAVNTSTSVSQIQRYLDNIGYFNAKVNSTPSINKKKKRIKISYDIRPGIPYTINKISYQIPDPEIKYYALQQRSLSLIDSNQFYNAYTLEEERDRITLLLQNKGYYQFNKEYIYFEVDSTLGNHQLDITVNIKNVSVTDSLNPSKHHTQNHHKYYIGDIYINTDYNPLVPHLENPDTLKVNIPRYNDPNHFNTYYFTYYDRLKIKPQTLTQAIFINTGKPFVLKDVQQSYKRLSNISLFKYANIQFEESPRAIDSLEGRLLNCRIQLSRAKLQAFTIEVEGTNTGGDLGVGGNLVYQNKNVFRGAELLTIRFKGAMEVQRLSKAESEGIDPNFLFFNTVETGTEVSLNIPRFLIPFPPSTFPKYFKPKTTITTGINYQRRPNYTRYITTLSFGYDWQESPRVKHIFFPFNINFVKVNPTPAFDSILNNLTDERLKNQYTNHLIPSLRYSFIFNNQDINKLKNFAYIRLNLETAGNLLNAIDQVINAPTNDEGYYTLFKVRYAQYVRTDIDARYYIILNENNRVALRGIFGIGIPYANSDDLPFEKGFYGGGANGMRAWRFRSLGPGAYSSPSSDFDRMGDIKLEANAEYRFPIYKFLKGAIFMDAGNVWLLDKDKTFPNGEFRFSSFLSEMAIDMGIGPRFDFGFFLFRIDGAVPIRDPSMPAHQRWSFNMIKWNRVMWNFGIGYPF